MGLIVPKFQSSAVARNRLRRRLLEIWRRQVQANQGGRDLVIKTRREAYAASFDDLKRDVLGWCKVSGIRLQADEAPGARRQASEDSGEGQGTE
jgi:ribonuclease P protein component